MCKLCISCHRHALHEVDTYFLHILFLFLICVCPKSLPWNASKSLRIFEGSVGGSGWWRGGDAKACMRVISEEGG